MSHELEVADFDAFFVDVMGRVVPGVGPQAPFPWQSRLVRQVAETGTWPAVLGLPTASGKTSVLLAGVFLLALQPERIARRLVMVVDRRLIVDQAYSLACGLADALDEATGDGVVARVAERLRRLTASASEAEAGGLVAANGASAERSGRRPLEVALLRGGVVGDNSWIRRPDQPLIVCSTVDQVGSRLLFQGYGVSPSMRSIHAGLLGQDCALFLDEVHLAEPFAGTLRSLHRLMPDAAAPPTKFSVTLMSATAGQSDVRPFPLWEAGERDDPNASPLRRRFEAPKPAELREIRAAGADTDRAIAQACAEAAVHQIGEEGMGTVAVVVNRVRRALLAYGFLQERLAKGGVDADVRLVTGRMRPLDRDEVLSSNQGIDARLRSGTRPAGDARPLILVATQCLEAGADYDFDGLVTECASLDALRQRFGRLDRVGRRAASGRVARAVIVGPSSAIKTGALDPVYGDVLPATWEWMKRQADTEGFVDFGVSAMMSALTGDMPPRPASPETPDLTLGVLEAWAERHVGQPVDLPAVAQYLHGITPVDTDVQVIWRVGLPALAAAFPASDAGDGPAAALPRGQAAEVLEEIRAQLDFCPPTSLEAMSVPISAVRRWLAQEGWTDVGDIEGTAEQGGPSTRSCRPFVVWQGDNTTVQADIGRVYPGATIVVPADYGGVTSGSWDPQSKEHVTDLGDLAQRHSGRWVLRLLPALTGLAPDELPATADSDDELPPEQVVREWLAAREEPLARPGWPDQAATPDTRFDVVAFWSSARPGSDERRKWYGLSGWAGQSALLAAGAGDADDCTSFTGTRSPVRLRDHLEGVGRHARALGDACQLDAGLCSDLELAGRLHDVGKIDPRFQAMLNQGSSPQAGEPLAKSTTSAGRYQRRQEAREQAKYPRHARHEGLSAALIASRHDLAGQASDWELVQHLVVSHHGWGRPFLPVAHDPEPVTVDWNGFGGSSAHGLERVGSPVPERFVELSGRLGHHRLAYLEALLRLADHEQSRLEVEGVSTSPGGRHVRKEGGR